MKPKGIMLIAGEASGDALAADLVCALGKLMPSATNFFGAGGPKMGSTGVEVVVDMMAHSTIGFDAIKNYLTFRRIFHQLLALAIERQPDVIVLVDFGHFNQRFARAIKNAIEGGAGTFSGWKPKIVKYVSPQVWASRPGRAKKMARDIDLLLCLFPFEKDWYAKRVPELRVEFVGHPISERNLFPISSHAEKEIRAEMELVPTIVLLPGSRVAELKRHLPVMLETAQRILQKQKANFEMVLPSENLLALARALGAEQLANFKFRTGNLFEALSHASLAISKTGTITLECAASGVPTIAFYKASWLTFQIGKRIVQVKFLAMPNLLADEEIFPEFVQDNATAENLSRAALELLNNQQRRAAIKTKLQNIIAKLGGPGASRRAAEAICRLIS